MIFDRDRTIDGLRLMRTTSIQDAETMDVIESAIFYLRADAPVECETIDIVDADTGKLLCVERFCGKCTHKLIDKDFCPHCGKQVKQSGQRWGKQE